MNLYTTTKNITSLKDFKSEVIEMKKYIVKEIYNIDNSVYFETLIDDLKTNFENDIFIGFNRDFMSINFELINYIENNIIYINTYELETYYKNNYAIYIIETLKKYKNISVKQACKIIGILNRYNGNDKKQLLCDILSVIFCNEYSYTILRGYPQSDWIYCIYKTSIEHSFIQYIEAVLFNTGIEIYISNDPIETENIGNIDELVYEGFYDYIVNYFKDSEKIKAVSELVNCNENEIAFFSIKDVKTITTYKVIYNEVK